MNAATITALISGLTALIGAVTTLIIQIQHIRNHGAMPADIPVNSPAKTGLINPAITDPKHN